MICMYYPFLYILSASFLLFFAPSTSSRLLAITPETHNTTSDPSSTSTVAVMPHHIQQLEPLDKRIIECYMTEISRDRGECKREECEFFPDGNEGKCYKGSDGGCVGERLGPVHGIRFSCQLCQCSGGRNKRTNVNGRSKTKKVKGKLGSHPSRYRISGGGSSLHQFSEWHNTSLVSETIADWAMNQLAVNDVQQRYTSLSWRSTEDILSLDPVNDDSTRKSTRRVTLLEPIKLSIYDDKRAQHNQLILSEATAEVDDNGLISSTSLRVLAEPNSKRADWSCINFHYTAEEGHRFMAAPRSDMVDIIYDLIAGPEATMSGVCAAILDDNSYWGTVKIWTGVDQDYLGDCPCSNLAYPGFIGEECGWGQWTDDPSGDPDWV